MDVNLMLERRKNGEPFMPLPAANVSNGGGNGTPFHPLAAAVPGPHDQMTSYYIADKSADPMLKSYALAWCLLAV
jgi:hypothetical protein